MQDLSLKSGLPIMLDGIKLVSEKITIPKADVRVYTQMKPALLSKSRVSVQEFYYMYRDVAPSPAFTKNNLRYDITIIPAVKIGQEFNKTLGHYHGTAKEGVSFTEVYQVISGTGSYLFQKKQNGRIVDVILAVAKEGDIVIIPTNYGHVTINTGKEPLVMANISEAASKSDYTEFVEKNGAAYYCICEGSTAKFVPNKNYGQVPPIRMLQMSGLGLKSPIYTDCLKNPQKYRFLTEPWNFIGEFEKLIR